MPVIIFDSKTRHVPSDIVEFCFQTAKTISNCEKVIVVTYDTRGRLAALKSLNNVDVVNPRGGGIRLFFVILKLLLKYRQLKFFCIQWPYFSSFTYIFHYIFEKSTKYSLCYQQLSSEPYHRYFAFFRKKWDHKVLDCAEQIFVFSQYKKKILMDKGVSKQKIKMIHYGIDTQKVCPGRVAEEFLYRYQLSSKRILLTVAPITASAGQDMIIRILGRMGNEYSDVIYVIIGEGPDTERQKLSRIAENLRVQKQVLILGKVFAQELMNFYHACDIFITLPSGQGFEDRYNQFVIPCITAAAVGKPILGAVNFDLEDIVIDGVTGFLVEPQDMAELKPKLKSLLDHKAIRESYGKVGFSRMEKNFSWNNSLESLCNWVTS